MSLYKYYHPDSFDFICINGGVSARFTQPEILNDIYEINGRIDDEMLKGRTTKILKEAGLSSIKDEEIVKLKNIMQDTLINDLGDLIKKTMVNKFGIFSLSKKKHSRAMWSYYSNDHSGFMITFKTNDEFVPPFIQGDDNYGSGEIIYSNSRPENLASLIKKTEKITSKDEKEKILIKYFLTKDDHWQHEDEYRVIASLNDIASSSLDNRGFQIHKCLIPTHHIESITLGVRADDILKRKALSWISNHKHKVKLYRAKPCNLTYDFIDEEILL